MATTAALLTHLQTLQKAVNAAINSASGYRNYGSKLTSSNRATHLATITTVPSALQHASNCSVCNAWDGSV